MEDESERRRGERVPVNREFAEPGARTPTWVSDLSEHGVFVHTRERLAIGTTIELRFTVILDEPVVIQALGKVVRHQSAPSGVGVEFGPISPEMVLRIHDVLARQRPRSTGAPLASAAPDLAEEEVTRTFDLTRLPTREFVARSISEQEFEEAKTGAFATIGGLSIPSDDDEGAASSSGGTREIADADLVEVDEEDLKTRPHRPIRGKIIDGE